MIGDTALEWRKRPFSKRLSERGVDFRRRRHVATTQYQSRG
jgi:hypothetical protein